MSSESPYARRTLVTDVAGVGVVVVPYRPAADWIDCVVSSSGTLALLVGLTSPETGDRITSGLLDDTVPVRAVQDASFDLLGMASPYTWWKTARLLSLSARDDIAGHLTLEGVDPCAIPVAQWVCAVYTLCTRNADAKGKFKVDAPLDDPPPGVTDDEWMSDTDFAAMVAQARSMPGQK